MNNNRLFGACAIIPGIVLCVVGLRLLLKPAEYQAAVKIEIYADYGPGPIPYDPYFLETELMAMKCDMVLSNVVQALDLNTEWGRRYGNGGGLSTENTIDLLRRRIRIDADRGTRLIEISVRDQSPDEAARIANAIAEAYRSYRLEIHRNQMGLGIAKLQKEYQEEVTNIVQMEATLKRLAKVSDLTNTYVSGEILQSRYPVYYKAKMDLRNQENLHTLLEQKIEEDKAHAVTPWVNLVTIVDPAVAPTNPIGPNRWLGVACLACGLVVLGCGFNSLRAGAWRGIA